MGSLIPLLWTSGDVCLGFQSQGASLACFLTCVILRFTSGATPADCIADFIESSLNINDAARLTVTIIQKIQKKRQKVLFASIQDVISCLGSIYVRKR